MPRQLELDLACRPRPRMVPCEQVQPGDLVRYGRAICWAAQLHPDDRPVLVNCCTPRIGWRSPPATRQVVMLRRV